MKSKVLNNGLRFIYNYKPGTLTSFSIGFEAGANVEKEDEIGLAHLVEHMVFKGTKNRNEFEINSEFDTIFGFNNAMTNFPYVVYYGTTLSEDFKLGLQLYSDVVLNPTFPEEGFKEEIQVVLEELKEWKEDIYQYCEDVLLSNAFRKRRIKELIIGNQEGIKAITIEKLRKFYDKYYCPQNCVISVVSSLDYEVVVKLIEAEFETWDSRGLYIQEPLIYEKSIPGIFQSRKEGLEGCKIQYCYDIHELEEKQIDGLRLFNFAFGEGTSSLLYDLLRTQNGLAYEVTSSIKNEKGIKLFSINIGISYENMEKTLRLIDKCVEQVKQKEFFMEKYNSDKLIGYSRMLRLKEELKYESGIRLANALTTNEIMYKKANNFFNNTYTSEEVHEIISRVLNNPTIQILH